MQLRVQPGAEAGQRRQRGQLPHRRELLLQPVRDLRARAALRAWATAAHEPMIVMMSMHVLLLVRVETGGGGMQRARTGVQRQRALHMQQGFSAAPCGAHMQSASQQCTCLA